MNIYHLYLRDKNYNLVGELTNFDKFECNLLFANPGRFALSYTLPEEMNADEEHLYSYMDIGCGIVLTRGTTTVISGTFTNRKFSRQNKRKAIELSGSDDTWLLSTRLALPVPGGPPYSSQAYDTRTGIAETIMRAYVAYNIGASATATRKIAALTQDTDLQKGAVITANARFQNLLELIRSISVAGGDLGFRIYQSGNNLVFSVYKPTDKTASIRFSQELGNLTDWVILNNYPAATYVYVGGTGTGTARTISEKEDIEGSLNYGRIEVFKDQRSESSTTALLAWGQSVLDLSEASVTIEGRATEIDYPLYQVDYVLGDLVTVVIEGVTYTEVIRGVVISLSAETYVVQPLIGNVAAKTGGLGFTKRLSEFEERLKALEAV